MCFLFVVLRKPPAPPHGGADPYPKCGDAIHFIKPPEEYSQYGVITGNILLDVGGYPDALQIGYGFAPSPLIEEIIKGDYRLDVKCVRIGFQSVRRDHSEVNCALCPSLLRVNFALDF